MTDLVCLERRGSVALLTLNRPDAFNALDAAVLEGLLEKTRAIGADRVLRAVVVTGAGRAFSAGADVAALRGMDAVAAQAFSRLGHRALLSLEELAVPTIAAVNGFALGGGCELACACDWIYASRAARFGQPEVKLGLVPGFGGTSRLVRRVGLAWAKEIALTGERFDAETALRIGLANRVIEPGDLVAHALEVGETIARNGPLAVAAAKRVMQEGQDVEVRVAHAFEQSAFGAIFATADCAEGLSAFLEKREPKFEGR